MLSFSAGLCNGVSYEDVEVVEENKEDEEEDISIAGCSSSKD